MKEILPSASPPEPPALRLLRSPQHAEAIWRELERNGAATPFQRYDWVDAWFRHGRDAGHAPLIVVAERCGAPVLLLPLELTRRGPVTVAQCAGGQHANLGAPLVASGAHLGPTVLTKLLRQAAAMADIDLFHFVLVPASLSRGPNPLAALPQAVLSDEDFFSLRLGEPLPGRTGEHRRKLRHKRRRLAQLGRPTFHKARSRDGVDRALASFLAQKAERFAVLGVPNPFARPGVAEFLRAASLAGLEQGQPAIELHWLELDDEPVAVFGAASDGTRLSGMLLSFTPDAAIARCSPGILLLDAVVEDAARRGLEVLDLGPGEARYKRQFAGQRDDLYEVVLPVTAMGHLTSRALQVARASKRAARRCSELTRSVAFLGLAGAASKSVDQAAPLVG